MHFLDDSLLPENQQKLVIQAAPFGPEWLPGDTDDLPLNIDAQVQKAVDCYNAGATVLHIHVRDRYGKGSRTMADYNEILAKLRTAVPKMLLQIGGSISFAPANEGEAAGWPAYDSRHMLAELKPKPDQVTIAINTTQMNIMDLMSDDDVANTSLARPQLQNIYRDMWFESSPSFFVEHLKRLCAQGIQPHFMLAHIAQLESVERILRRGQYKGPLVLNYVAIGGGASGTHPADLIEFIRRTPDGAVLTIESVMRSVAPMCTIAIALGQHVRVGIEDNLWRRKGERMTTVQQIEQMVRISRELGREVATGEEARRIYQIGVQYSSTEETLAKLGMPPNRISGQRGAPLRKAA